MSNWKCQEEKKKKITIINTKYLIQVKIIIIQLSHFKLTNKNHCYNISILNKHEKL